MELIKKNIHMNKIKSTALMQMTLEDDINVPDVKPDVGKIIRQQAQVKLSDHKITGGKLSVTGVMEFCVIYISSEDGRLVHSISGKIPFDDIINMEQAKADDIIKISYSVDDLSATMVNSRKISIRSIISFDCVAENIYDRETAVDIVADEGCPIESVSKDIEVTQISINKKDILRIREEVMLPSSKQNVMEILYSDVDIHGFTTRVTDEGINAKGEVQFFVMYMSDDGGIQFFEKEIPFNEHIRIDGCSEDMIDDIRMLLSGTEVSVKPDEDGEERIITLEVSMNLDIKLYREETISVLRDFYGTGRIVTPVYEEGMYDNILMKNSSSIRVSDTVEVDDKEPVILQLCNAHTVVKLDDSHITDEGIKVEGVVEVSLMYVTADDMIPVNSIQGVIPFAQLIEVKGISEDCIYNIRPGVEHCTVMMSGSREFEVKVSVSLEAVVFEKVSENAIVDFTCEDEEYDSTMPAMIGYVVGKEDTLWELAKKYRTTTECIKMMNFMEKDEVSEGDRILIVREAAIY